MTVIEKMMERLTFFTITDEKLRFAMNETISKLKDRDMYSKLLHEDVFKHDIIKRKYVIEYLADLVGEKY